MASKFASCVKKWYLMYFKAHVTSSSRINIVLNYTHWSNVAPQFCFPVGIFF